MKTENAYSSKELNSTTWPDFETLFAKHNGVWGGCWCMFYHTIGEFLIKGHGPDNKKTKKALVKKRRTHGIIVYSGKTPIGWVQYGPKPELPRLDASKTYPETQSRRRRKAILANNLFLRRPEQSTTRRRRIWPQCGSGVH